MQISIAVVVTFILTLIFYTPLLLLVVYCCHGKKWVVAKYEFLKIQWCCYCLLYKLSHVFIVSYLYTGVLLREWTHTTCRLFMKKWAKLGLKYCKILYACFGHRILCLQAASVSSTSYDHMFTRPYRGGGFRGFHQTPSKLMIFMMPYGTIDGRILWIKYCNIFYAHSTHLASYFL